MKPCDHCDINAEIRSMREILERVEKSIEGNGRKGLRERVEALENWRTGLSACIALVIGWVKFLRGN